MTLQEDGIRKAAILVSSLGAAEAERLLAQMGPQQAQRVRRTVDGLGLVDPEERERTLAEFLRVDPPSARGPHPGVEVDPELARKFSAPPSGEAEPPRSGAPFRLLRQAEADKLARILNGERPQTIALVLSHLAPEQAGAVLVRFAPDIQVDIVRRLVDLEETQPEILREVERALEARLSEQVSLQRRRVAGFSAVSGILRASAPGVSVQILESLAAHDRTLAERFEPEKVEFGDLVHQDDATLATILEAADPALVKMGLIGAPPALIERMLAHLPAAEAEMIRHQLDHPGPLRLRDVEEARRRIAEVARRLAMERRIGLRRAEKVAQ